MWVSWALGLWWSACVLMIWLLAGGPAIDVEHENATSPRDFQPPVSGGREGHTARRAARRRHPTRRHRHGLRSRQAGAAVLRRRRARRPTGGRLHRPAYQPAAVT